MTLAFTISAYRMHSFVRLGVAQLRKLCPQSPILISDDPSVESEHIRAVADEYGCTYRCPTKRRGHFSGDMQGIINSVAFGQACKADVAIKVSQRFVFRKPEAIGSIIKCFEDENIMAATPGKPRVTNGSNGFGAFGTLSDVLMIRVGSVSPEELLQIYRGRLMREQVPWRAFIECFADSLHSVKFPGRTRKIEELTNHSGDPIYLRRYQNSESQYRALALENGFNGIFPLTEWGGIEQRAYICNPIVA